MHLQNRPTSGVQYMYHSSQGFLIGTGKVPSSQTSGLSKSHFFILNLMRGTASPIYIYYNNNHSLFLNCAPHCYRLRRMVKKIKKVYIISKIYIKYKIDYGVENFKILYI